MPKDKVKIVLLLAVVFTGLGIYKCGKASYTALSWEKTIGVISDFQSHNFSCGRRSVCYSLLIAYSVGDRVYRVNSNEKFNDPPTHLEGKDVIVYYAAENPSQATVGGEYGPMNDGLIALAVGSLFFVIYWFVRPRNNR